MALDLSPMIGLILLLLAQGDHRRADRGVRGSGRLGRAALVALVAVALDQVSKAIVRTEIAARRERSTSSPEFDLVRVSNDGIAFGMLDGAGPVVLVIAALAFAVLLGVFLAGAERRGLWLPIGLLAGGAVGNLIDRILDGAVTDFIDPPSWPAFNLADVEITIGVFLLVGIYLLGEEEAGEGRRGEAARGERRPSLELRRAADRPRATSTSRSSTSRPAWSSTRLPASPAPTLVDALGDLLAGGTDPERPGIVHRLDRDTSGLLVVARSAEAHAALSSRRSPRAR